MGSTLVPYADAFGLQRFRENELIHGRWAMLACLGVCSSPLPNHQTTNKWPMLYLAADVQIWLSSTRQKCVIQHAEHRVYGLVQWHQEPCLWQTCSVPRCAAQRLCTTQHAYLTHMANIDPMFGSMGTLLRQLWPGDVAALPSSLPPKRKQSIPQREIHSLAIGLPNSLMAACTWAGYHVWHPQGAAEHTLVKTHAHK